MKKFIVSIGLTLLACTGFGQNLVPNGSFEDTTNCSIDNQIFRTPPWQQPTAGSSDWLNLCASSPAGATVPSNVYGWQNAQEGGAYAGIILFYEYYNYREYIQVPLLDTLAADTKYWISFYINLSDSSEYAVSNVGAYFSDTSISNPDAKPLVLSSQITSGNSYLADKNNWTHVSGSYTAIGGEKFLTIGTFQDSVAIDTLNVGTTSVIGQGTAYYYIDNICVSTDSTACEIPSGVSVDELNRYISFYPNPFSSSAVIAITPSVLDDGQIYYSIYDMMGNLVRKELITENQTSINRSELSSGIYLITVIETNKILFRKKIIIN